MVNKVEQRIIELITPIVDRRKELLWDLTYTKEGGQKVLRILLDKPNHQFITMADLTAFTQEVNELLDTSDPDPIPEAYLLDISSPGADRPLRRRGMAVCGLCAHPHQPWGDCADGSGF